MIGTESASTPPHSTEAEQSVLGAVLQDNGVFDKVSTLRAADFYEPRNGAIWSSIMRLVSAGRAADVVTVKDDGEHDIEYLNALAYSVPSSGAAISYAGIVRERALRRRLMQIGGEVMERARSGMESRVPVAELIDRTITELLALQEGRTDSEPQEMAPLTVKFIDNLQERADGRIDSFSTGLSALDRLTGEGGRPGELWVIGARPSMGKTAFVLSLCRHVGVAHRVLMLTQEDSLMALTARHVAAAGRVNLAHLRNPKTAPPEMWNGVISGVAELAPLMVSMDDQATLTMADVRRKVQQVKRRHGGLALIVIDYLQLMEGQGDNRNQSLGMIANGLKRAAKEFGCWIVLLSQLNREADKRTGPPQMSDLRDSGDIEGAADLIGLLHREWQRKPTAENKYLAELHVCKHKNGPTSTLKLYFDGAFQRFGNWQENGEDDYV
jgi:replicative DNA helicase